MIDKKTFKLLNSGAYGKLKATTYLMPPGSEPERFVSGWRDGYNAHPQQDFMNLDYLRGFTGGQRFRAEVQRAQTK